MPDAMLTSDGIVLGGVLLRWYGLIMVGAALAALVFAANRARRRQIAPEHIWRAAVWVLPLAIVGARLWYGLFPPESSVAVGRTREWLWSHPLDLNQGLIAVWMGGLGLFGGLLGGALGLWLYARRARLPWRNLLDIAALAALLGIVIGRWADGANQEVYGLPTLLPWGVLVDDVARRVAPFTDINAFPLESTTFHPVWLYESVWCGLLFALLLARGQRYASGQLAALALIGYCVGRFALELLRVNGSWLGAVNVSQVACLVGMALGVILWRRWRPARPPNENQQSG